MEEHHDSPVPLHRPVETWAADGRGAEIDRVVQTLQDELRRPGYYVSCQRKAET